MLSFPQLKQLLWLGLLSTQALASYIPRHEQSENSAAFGLQRRDDGSPDATPSDYICSLENCGPPCDSTFARRSWLPYDISDDLFENITQEDVTPGSLVKRTFDWDISRSHPQFESAAVNGFYVAGSEQTEAHQSKLMDADDNAVVEMFQWGTGGLHGCSMLTIVSKRGVWMAHFWESQALNRRDELEAEDLKLLQKNVIGALLGNGKQMEYVDPIDWSLFNGDCDDTRVIWMTPVHMNTPFVPADYPAYQNKIGKVEEVIAKYLPNIANDNGGIDSEKFLYQRLMYQYNGGNYKGQDANNVDKSAYGQTIFQWDGESTWRLFYEHNMYSNDDSQDFQINKSRPVALRTSMIPWTGING